MATVYQRSGIYYAKFFDAHGKRVSKNTGASRKRDAQKIAAGMEAEALEERRKAKDRPRAYAVILETAVRETNAGELTLARSEELLRRLRAVANPDFREVSLDEWFASWIDAQRPHIGDSTAASYEDAQRRLNAAWGESKANGPLTELTNIDVRQAITQVAKKVRAVTANMDLAVLRRVLEAATVERLVTANVAKSIRSLPTTDSTERAPFTAAEVRRLIDSAPTDEWRGLVLLAAHTGLRLSDVLALHRNNIEGTDIIIRPKKTARSKRTVRVPMTPPVAAWVGERKGSFFPVMSKKTTQTHSMTFVSLLKKAGVPRDVILPGGIQGRRSFHSLRHSFTSWLAEADVHSDIRRKLTGHRSAGVHDRYTHHDESLARAVAELPDITSTAAANP